MRWLENFLIIEAHLVNTEALGPQRCEKGKVKMRLTLACYRPSLTVRKLLSRKKNQVLSHSAKRLHLNNSAPPHPEQIGQS